MKQIVLDTNVFLVSIGRNSKYHWIFKALLEGKYELIVTTPILLEYYEIISQRADKIVAEDTLKLLLSLPNVIQTTIYYNWNLIEIDKDDNHFVDAAIAANAAVIVTEDKHFNILKKIDFPEVLVIGIKDFEVFLNSL
jgi:putative PIN family toxin of toxin-antitoxin system